jgi:hypothetical protein
MATISRCHTQSDNSPASLVLDRLRRCVRFDDHLRPTKTLLSSPTFAPPASHGGMCGSQWTNRGDGRRGNRRGKMCPSSLRLRSRCMLGKLNARSISKPLRPLLPLSHSAHVHGAWLRPFRKDDFTKLFASWTLIYEGASALYDLEYCHKRPFPYACCHYGNRDIGCRFEQASERPIH